MTISKIYRGSLIYAIFTTGDPTTAFLAYLRAVVDFSFSKGLNYSPTNVNFALRSFFQVPKSA